MDNAPLKELSLLTIIAPVFNEAETIPLFFNRTPLVLCEIEKDYKINLLFMNNASTDKTFDVISNLRESHEFVHLISLSGNVGYQKSVECGLRNAKGEILVVIDVDCEDLPELLLPFISQYETDFDLAYGSRADRSENKIMKLCRKFFYHIVRGVSLTMISHIYVGRSLSAISLYLARTYKNGIQRPNYFIHKRYSFLQDSVLGSH